MSRVRWHCVLVCWLVGLLACWFVGLLLCWFVGVVACRCVRVSCVFVCVVLKSNVGCAFLSNYVSSCLRDGAHNET